MLPFLVVEMNIEIHRTAPTHYNSLTPAGVDALLPWYHYDTTWYRLVDMWNISQHLTIVEQKTKE